MMTNLVRRAEDLARARQRRQIAGLADHLKTVLRGAAIEVEEARVLVTGRGLFKRWLIDPSLRFLSGGLR